MCVRKAGDGGGCVQTQHHSIAECGNPLVAVVSFLAEVPVVPFLAEVAVEYCTFSVCTLAVEVLIAFSSGAVPEEIPERCM